MPNLPAGRRDAVVGILFGLVPATVIFLSAYTLGPFRPVVPIPTPVPTVTATPGCVAPSSLVASVGFDPYAILSQKRPDVLAFYAANGWNLTTRCTQALDDWTAHGAGGGAPTTPARYVRRQGWAPATRQPTPTPFAGCSGPPSLVARLGYDPYRLLGEHRPDVERLYAANGWKPATQCVQLFDDWLQHPDGGPPTTAAAYVTRQGWAGSP